MRNLAIVVFELLFLIVIFRVEKPGLTRVEWLMVLIIVGVLASIAVPVSHCSEILDSRVIEGVEFAKSAKSVVAENAANGLAFDTGWKAPNATKNVSSKANPTLEDLKSNANSGIAINPANGIITITYTDRVAKGSPTILLIPVVNVKANKLSTGVLPTSGVVPEDVLWWQCHSATAPEGNAFPQLLGTFNEKCLPANCRYIAPTAWERFSRKLDKLLSLS